MPPQLYCLQETKAPPHFLQSVLRRANLGENMKLTRSLKNSTHSFTHLAGDYQCVPWGKTLTNKK